MMAAWSPTAGIASLINHRFKARACKKIELQRRAELIQARWTPDHDYVPPPARGKLVALEGAILVAPQRGLERGYVPILVRQQLRE